MRKLLFIFIITSINTSLAQETTNTNQLPKNELKINMLNLILFEGIDLAYERILNKNSSMGFGANYFFSELNDNANESKYEVIAFYRNYFTNKYNQGFFIEVFTIHSQKEYTVFSENLKINTLAPGVSIGGKWATKKGFLGEIFLGVGRNLINTEDTFQKEHETLYISNRGEMLRFGISIGKRF